MSSKSSPNDIRRVAAEAGVSIATVSRVLNNPSRVSLKTRQRVLEVAKALGYRPNGIARGLVTGKSHMVGLVIPDIEGPLYGAMARGVEDVLGPAGLHSMLVSSDRNPAQEAEAINSLLERQVDGLIIVGSGLSEQTLHILQSAHLPWVLLDREAQMVENSVVLDNRLGGRLAAEYLVRQGHRHIAHIAGIRLAGEERLLGFQEGLAGAGLEPFAIVQGDFSEPGGQQAAQKLLGQGLPQAIFVANDRMAAGVYRTLRLHQLRIPQDVSVIGFDGAPFGIYLDPPLTTLQQPAREMGRSAATLLLELRSGARPQSRIIAPELVERESVAKPVSQGGNI